MNREGKAFSQKIMLLLILVFISLLVFGHSGGRPSTTKIEGLSYSSNIWCGDNQTVRAKACVYCGTCMNGMSGYFRIYYPTNTLVYSSRMGDQGHNWDKLCWGPYQKSFPVSGPEGQKSFKITASLVNGCHCDASSTSTTRYFTCTDPNPPPVVNSIAITNPNTRTGNPPTTDITLRNRLSAETKEIVQCYGSGSDERNDGSEGVIVNYSFSLKYKLPSGTRVSMTNVTDYISITTGDLGSGVKYENFELIKRIPVGSEIYCRLVVTDEEGATGSGESL